MSKESYEIEGANAWSQAKQEEKDLILVATLGLTPMRDGNQWCVSWGDAPEGVQGFGDTPAKAVENFNFNYYHETLNTPKSEGLTKAFFGGKNPIEEAASLSLKPEHK